ncbi:hypothetical protein BDZ97DRAFT_888328 [Flammula alnicola]|nr:hypothetical protein BDZ97DRAFT_888328 [Flammula alnicola]
MMDIGPKALRLSPHNALSTSSAYATATSCSHRYSCKIEHLLSTRQRAQYKDCFWRFSNRKTQSSGSQSAPREADGRSVDIQDGYSSQDSDSDSQEEYSQDEEDSWRACKFEATSQTRRSAQTTAADSQIQGHSLINTINRTPFDNPCSPSCSGPYEQFLTDTRGNVTTVKHHCSWGPNETIRVESPCTLDLDTEAGCPGYVEEDKVDEHGNTAVVSQLCGHEKCQRARQEIWKHFRNSQDPGIQRWR